MLDGWDETSVRLTVHQEKLILKVTRKGEKSKRWKRLETTEIPHFVSVFVGLQRHKVIKAYDKIHKA